MQEMTEQDEQVKTGIDEILSIVESDLSDAQKLVAILVAAGVSDKAEIAKRLGKSVRSIEPHYATLRIRGYAYSRNANTRIHVSKTDKNGVGTLPAINTELPKGNTLSVAVGGVGDVEEIPGLNGSTPRLVQQLAEWIAGDFGVPNLKTSRDLIAGNVEFHGADKVRQGMLDLEALLASGEKPRNVSKLFAVYVKRATLEPQQRQKKESFAERQRREAFELLAEMGALDESAAH